MSFARMSAGAHFFSDTVVSFFVMLLAADVFWYYVVLTPVERKDAALNLSLGNTNFRWEPHGHDAS